MSTILKALRRLERDRSAQDGRPLKDEVTAAPAAASRRGFPLLALVISAGALGLGLGASLLWLWPREGADAQVAEAPAAAMPEAAATPPVAVAPPAPRPVIQVPTPEPVVAALPSEIPSEVPTEIAEPAPEDFVASAPPAPEPAPPVAVISLPAPPRAAEPAPPILEERKPMAARPAAPERGSEPPNARRKTSRAPAPARAAPPPPVARAATPEVLVSSTVWHPQRDRRLAMVEFEGGAARELHEGDAIGSLVVSEIGPSSVVFLHEGVELRRRVGARN